MKDSQKAKFVKKIGVITSPRTNKYWFNQCDDGNYYKIARGKSDYKVGDHAFYAKLRNTHRSQDFVWDIYEIILPESIIGLPQYCKTYFYKGELLEKTSFHKIRLMKHRNQRY